MIIGQQLWGLKSNIQYITGADSSHLFQFDLDPFIQGQTWVSKLKVAIYHLLLFQ